VIDIKLIYFYRCKLIHQFKFLVQPKYNELSINNTECSLLHLFLSRYIQGDSYSIIQTLTGGRFQPLETLTKMSSSKVKIVEDKAC
jgi:hypothetical protein